MRAPGLDTEIRCEIAEYVGWDYDVPSQGSLVAQPSALVPPAVVWKPGRKTRTVCCVFVGGVLGRLYPTWPAGSWSLLMVPRDRPWAMVEAIVAAGHGREVATPAPGRWHVWQGTSGLVDGKYGAGTCGHQGFLAPDGRLVEATTYTDEDGDGKSTDPGAVAWRLRAWATHVARHDRVRLVELLEP